MLSQFILIGIIKVTNHHIARKTLMSNFYLNITLFTLEYADVFASIHAKFMFLGTVIIDVGINRISDSTRKRGWRTVGDVDRESITDRDVSYTPVPGGVGLMTVASLMENTFISRERRG